MSNPVPITLDSTATTAPTNANDVVMFTPPNVGFAQFAGTPRIQFSILHDQAGTLKLQQRRANSSTWDTIHEEAMAGSATEADAADFYVAPYYDWRVIWTNGGVTQTVWQPRASLSEEASPTQ